MKEAAPLMALVWRPPAPAAARAVDPLEAAAKAALEEADVWRWSASLVLTRSDGLVALRFFLPARSQGARDTDKELAQRGRAALARVLASNGLERVFTDALWCERGGQGWAVVARAAAPKRSD